MSIKQNTTSLQEILNDINNLPDASSGVELPELSNPGTASDLLSGKELIDGDGNKITGTMPTVTQATPSVSVNSSGLITASATQTAGYVSAGTKSGTKQLTTQAAQTITPGTSNKTIASGRYLTGTQTIKGDANLVAGNIANGVSIFGVTGTHSSGENLDTELATQTELISQLSEILDSKASGGGGSGDGANFETSIVTMNIPAACKYLGTDFQAKEETTSTFETIKNSIVHIKGIYTDGSGCTVILANQGTFLSGVAVQLDEAIVNISITTGGGGAN